MPFKDFVAMFNSTVVVHGTNQDLETFSGARDLCQANCFELSRANQSTVNFFVTIA